MGIVGLDLAGNEAEFSADPFIKILQNAQKEGLHLTIHAGEWGAAENVAQAIDLLGAERIGHGIRVLESENSTRLALERKIPFEVCITSNYQSGVVPEIAAHPIGRMLTKGLNVTINSDDPSISTIQLSDEYRLVCEVLDIPLEILRGRIIAAAWAAFLPDNEKENLAQAVDREFSNCLARFYGQ